MRPPVLLELLPASINLRLIIIRVVVDYTITIRRHITGHLLEALADTPVVLVNGARQAGSCPKRRRAPEGLGSVLLDNDPPA